MAFNFNRLDQPFVTTDQSGSYEFNNSIGILLPFNTQGGGLFRKSYFSIDQAKTNLLNLLSTRKGERLYHIDFGTDLYKAVFEQFDADGELEGFVRSTIVKALETWTPYLVLRSIRVSQPAPEVSTGEAIHSLKIDLVVSFDATFANINVVIFINNQGIVTVI
jgi:phage baseplate assembly protein W